MSIDLPDSVRRNCHQVAIIANPELNKSASEIEAAVALTTHKTNKILSAMVAYPSSRSLVEKATAHAAEMNVRACKSGRASLALDTFDKCLQCEGGVDWKHAADSLGECVAKMAAEGLKGNADLIALATGVSSGTWWAQFAGCLVFEEGKWSLVVGKWSGGEGNQTLSNLRALHVPR